MLLLRDLLQNFKPCYCYCTIIALIHTCTPDVHTHAHTLYTHRYTNQILKNRKRMNNFQESSLLQNVSKSALNFC